MKRFIKKIVSVAILILLVSCSSKATIAYFPDEKVDITKIKMQEVESTSISHVGYSNGTLIVVFKKNYDRCYVYNMIPEDVYHELLSADSIGSYYNSEIRGKYESNRIDGVEIEDQYIKYKW